MYYILTNVIGHCEDWKDVELEVLAEGTKIQRQNNSNRSYTVAFRYPENFNFYISVRSAALKECISSWMGYLTDFFILHSHFLEKEFILFDSAHLLNLVIDIDKQLDSE